MSVRKKNGRWIIEIYDPACATKRHVTREEMRALGFDAPTTERQARKIEREVLRERDRHGLLGREETIGAFATRWPDDYRRSGFHDANTNPPRLGRLFPAKLLRGHRPPPRPTSGGRTGDSREKTSQFAGLSSESNLFPPVRWK
jgi:hypothetical protein